MNGLHLLSVSVGNSRTALGCFADGAPTSTERVENDDRAATLRHAEIMWETIAAAEEPMIVLASVNGSVSEPLAESLRARLGQAVWTVGVDVPVPIGTQLDPETIVGVDRLLNGAAAWDRLHSACVVVDAGTAVTVDFIDGVGTFQGGAIAPGARMQLAALHERTGGLPAIELARPDAEAFGKNTRQAMLQGVCHGIRGLVWRLVERYAESYGAFPPVIATGGDAELLFEGDELVTTIVPDLTLLGMAVAVRVASHDGSDTGA